MSVRAAGDAEITAKQAQIDDINNRNNNNRDIEIGLCLK